MTPLLFFVTGSPLDAAAWVESYRPSPAAGSRAAGASHGSSRIGVSNAVRRESVAGRPVVRDPRPAGGVR